MLPVTVVREGTVSIQIKDLDLDDDIIQNEGKQHCAEKRCVRLSCFLTQRNRRLLILSG